MPILSRAHRNRCVGKFGRALTMGRRKYRALRSTRRQALASRVQSFHNVEDSRQFACRYTSLDRTDEAGEKIPRLPLMEPREIRRCHRTRFADKKFHDRRIAFGAESLRNAQNCLSIDTGGLEAVESGKSRRRRSVQPVCGQFQINIPAAPRHQHERTIERRRSRRVRRGSFARPGWAH